MIIIKDKIRMKFLILFLFFLSKVLSQEQIFHQPDSIYKSNKIKSISLYYADKLFATVLCNKEGKWIEYKIGPRISGWYFSEYFEYDESGKLIKKTELIKDEHNQTKTFEIETEYSKDDLKKLTKYNPDGTLNEIEYFENMGRKKISEQYKNGQIFNKTITEYLDDFNVKKVYRWFIKPNSEKTEWSETFDYKFKKGQIKKYSRYDNGKKRITFYLKYHKNNLIKKVIFNNTVENYKYERY